MKKLFGALGLMILVGCGGPTTKKNFSEEFKEQFVSSCAVQAGVNMSKDVASSYCACALEKVMDRWDNDEEAGEGMASMPVNEIQRILVMPCIQQ